MLEENKQTSPEHEEKTRLEEETGSKNAVQDEIDSANAEDAEDQDNKRRHSIPLPNYHAMSLEQVIDEFQKLLANEKVQTIKTHVEQIKHEFDIKYQDLIERKREDFLNEGGNEIDFKYVSPLKNTFGKLYATYQEKRDSYYKNLEHALKANLAKRLEIIEQLKALIALNEDMAVSYRKFRELQEQWKKAGAIPRNQYNDVWRTFQHHTEIFYDLLALNREFQEIDFKRNLEEKQKIIVRAEQLLQEEDSLKAFTELQRLHHRWKEEIGPVDREHREPIWERFSELTKAIHQKRQAHLIHIQHLHEQNLLKKREIIQQMQQLALQTENTHRSWQNHFKEIERLREAFFQAGKVPHEQTHSVWADFKEAIRNFNRTKNNFYKNLKKEQFQNLEEKRKLLDIAQSLKDSEDWEQATPVMKKIQLDWKQIGQVPSKYSDAVWADFKDACNHYFQRLHTLQNQAGTQEQERIEKKQQLLEELKNTTAGNDINLLQGFLERWEAIGKIPPHKRQLESAFYKTIEDHFNKLPLEKTQLEIFKYTFKISKLTDSPALLDKERLFVERKINELTTELRQLENNLHFISNASKDNPIVKNILQTIDTHKENLDIWKVKLKEIRKH